MQHRFTTWLLSVLLVFPFAFAFRGQAQTLPTAISRFDQRITPPSPQATQLGVFGSTPPNLNTGAVQTTVPLLEVKNRQLSLAVSLNYNYTGLQVTEAPSWVGLGWTLSAGGIITRTVQGLPDELNGKGYFAGGWTALKSDSHPGSLARRAEIGGAAGLVTVSAIGNLNRYLFHENICAGDFDSEPDAYTVSTPFYSGKLFINFNGIITCSPHTDVKFTGSASSGWTATTGDGTIYRYAMRQVTEPADPQGPFIAAPTAWYLTQIESVDGGLIELGYGADTNYSTQSAAVTVTQDAYSRYANRELTPCSRQALRRTILPNVLNTSWSGQNNTKVNNLRLTYITTSTGSTDATTQVEFISDTQRGDLDDQIGRKLTRIIYRDLVTQQVKTQYDLTYDYFNPTGIAKEKRLKLLSVQERGKPSYVFTYQTTTTPGTNAVNGSRDMPSRESLARDHWGYYNGHTDNTSLLPSLPPSLAATYFRSTSGMGRASATRLPDAEFARLGALTEIQYPTGGRTKYTYEPNTVEVPNDYADNPQNQFGGVLVGTPTLSFWAHAQGGPGFPMDFWEREYARRYNPFTQYIDPNTGNGGVPIPQNVRAERIDAPNGFTLADVRCWGRVTSAYGNCGPLPQGQAVQVFMYQLEDDSTTLLPLCKVGFDAVNATTGGMARCTTRVSTGGPLGSDLLKTRLNFAAGTYYLIAEVNSNDATFEANIAVDLNLNPPPPTTSTPRYQTIFVGGIRLAKTMDLTETGDTITKAFRYRQVPDGGPDRSSGVLFFQPEYAYVRPCGELVVSEQNIGKLNWLDAGFHVGYSRVEVESSGRRAGTTVYYYNNRKEHGPSCRDVVMKVEEFNQTGGLVKQTLNTYDFESIASSPGFRLSKEYDIQIFSTDLMGVPIQGAGIQESGNYWFANRSYTSFWPKLRCTTEQVFGSAGAVGSRQDTTTFSYQPYGPGKTTQPTRVVKYLGDHRQLITRTHYGGQYTLDAVSSSSNAPAVGLAGLMQYNMVSVPVEHQTWLRTGADSVVLGGDLTHFANLRPARIFALAPATPITAASFVAPQVQNGMFQQDARYIERVAFPRYSAMGSLLQQRVAQALPTSYLWGHAETRLIAEAQNASYSQIAFTSFEPDAEGSWQYNAGRCGTTAFTGTKGYQLDGTTTGALRRPDLPAGEYELLLWAQSPAAPQLTGVTSKPAELLATAGSWQQYRYRLSAAATATLQVTAAPNSWIDELRLAPVGAQLTTYTYDPLVGMTSQTDPSGRTTTYEYDAVGRLVRTRDEQGRLLSQQEYHYARPQ